MIGREADQAKNEEAVGKLGASLREHEARMIALYREQETALPDTLARVGDLAIARCQPCPDMYRILIVTRIDGEGRPTHLRDGKGTRYADDAREKRGVAIMPEQIVVLPRRFLAVPAREIAAEYADSHFCGVGGVQAIVDGRLRRFLKAEGGRS